MENQVLLYLGSALAAIWGIAHLIPTQSVVRGFGNIGVDNKRILTMEWITEGVALIFIGALVATVAALDASSMVSRSVYLVSAVELLLLATVSVFTGFRVKFLPYKLCPFVFSASAILILLGGMVR